MIEISSSRYTIHSFEIFFTTVLPDNCAAGSGGVGLPDQSFLQQQLTYQLEEKGEFSDK